MFLRKWEFSSQSHSYHRLWCWSFSSWAKQEDYLRQASQLSSPSQSFVFILRFIRKSRFSSLLLPSYFSISTLRPKGFISFLFSFVGPQTKGYSEVFPIFLDPICQKLEPAYAALSNPKGGSLIRKAHRPPPPFDHFLLRHQKCHWNKYYGCQGEKFTWQNTGLVGP